MSNRGYASVISLLFLICFSMSINLVLNKQVNAKLAFKLSEQSLKIDSQYNDYIKLINKLTRVSKASSCSNIKTNKQFNLKYRCIPRKELLSNESGNLITKANFNKLSKHYLNAPKLEDETSYYMVYVSTNENIQELRILNKQNKTIFYAYYE